MLWVYNIGILTHSTITFIKIVIFKLITITTQINNIDFSISVLHYGHRTKIVNIVFIFGKLPMLFIDTLGRAKIIKNLAFINRKYWEFKNILYALKNHIYVC